MTNITIYGIPNCDTVKKARKWLDAECIDYTFHDYKKEGVDEAELARWADTVGWEVLLNRRGTTYRKLPDDEKADVDREKALRLMAEHPSLIKRPVAMKEDAHAILVGFTQSEWENAFA
ncbi:ArsC family reductase [Qipengyuania atrilutea]|uniref:ArsC family reductase n=1 Tax=Qipengyuania atrilutea TaxID=2744473 RepID=A0A850H5X5_9SPHN|nr:ArsC family reductase [Actirhodobacter atriluteus]NVD45243.1 ArsC family reductase [Actirhodobacter atriluteus]